MREFYSENMFNFRLSQNFKEIGATLIKGSLRGGGGSQLVK